MIDIKFLKYRSLISSSTRIFSVGLVLASGTFLSPCPVLAQDALPQGNVDDMGSADSTADSVNSSDKGADDKSADSSDPFSFDDTGMGLEKSASDLENDFRKKAFDQALKKALPLNPDEIRELLERFDRTVESSNIPVHPYPRPESVVQNVSLDPGSPPLVVHLAFGYVTTLSMLDSSGAPWPIEDISWVGNFDVMEQSGHDFTNLLRISPSSKFAHGNISIRLLNLDVPIVMTFETGRDMVHYRFDAVVPRSGPQAQAPIIDTGITLASGDADMSVALSGVLPRDAEPLSVSGTDGRTTAYVYNGLTYVRTPLTLLSPAWDSSVTSADGMNIYALEDTPVILLSDKGRMVRAYLNENENEDLTK